MVAKRVSICRQQDAIADMPQKSTSMVVKTDRGDSRQMYALGSYGAGAVSQRCDSRVYGRQAGSLGAVMELGMDSSFIPRLSITRRHFAS